MGADLERRIVGAQGAATVDGGGVALGADDVHEALEARPDAGVSSLLRVFVVGCWRRFGRVCWNKRLALRDGVLRTFVFGRSRIRMDGEAALHRDST